MTRILVGIDAPESIDASNEAITELSEGQEAEPFVLYAEAPSAALELVEPEERDVGQLVIGAAEGDRAAWESLVERFSGLIWSIARGYRLNYSDAADVCQTTWLHLVEHLHRIRKPGRVGAWLATTARRECLRALRHSGRQIPVGDSTDVESYGVEVVNTSSVEDRVIASDEAATLWRVCEQIPERWQLLLRALVSDPSPTYEDVGKALGMPIGSIGPTRARCLERLRRNIDLANVSANSEASVRPGRAA